MGMRFDKIPVAQWVSLGNKLGGAYVQGQAADAGAKASEQKTQTESNFGAVDPNATYQGDGADGAMTNAEAASYGVNTPKEDAAAGTGTTRRYSLGDSQVTQDKEFTPAQKRTANLRAQADFYAGQGDTDRATAIDNQIYGAEQQGRQRTQWAEDDRIKAGVKKSDEAFKAALGAFSGPQLSPVQAAAPAGASAADPAQPGAPVAAGLAAPATGATPTLSKAGKPGYANAEATDPRVLAAMQAKTEVLLKEGLMPQYKEAFMQTADMRAKVRAAAFSAADKQYAMTGDPTVYAKKIYPLIDDGHDFVSGKMEQGPDGKPVMNLVRKNTETGQDEPISMPVEQFLRTVEIARDPAAVLAAEAAHAKKRFETNEKIREEQAKAVAVAAEARRTEGIKHDNAVTLEGIKSGNNIKEIGVRLGGERSNTAERITLEQQAPRVLSEGAQLTVPQRQADGSIKYVTAATGGKKQPTPVKDSDISNIVINNYGTENMTAGRKLGNEQTGRIAAAARVIMKANPGLDANQAIEAAAREVNKPQGAK